MIRNAVFALAFLTGIALLIGFAAGIGRSGPEALAMSAPFDDANDRSSETMFHYGLGQPVSVGDDPLLSVLPAPSPMGPVSSAMRSPASDMYALAVAEAYNEGVIGNSLTYSSARPDEAYVLAIAGGYGEVIQRPDPVEGPEGLLPPVVNPR